MSKEERLYKIAVKIKARGPLRPGEGDLAQGHGIARLNSTRYGYELTDKGEKIAGGEV